LYVGVIPFGIKVTQATTEAPASNDNTPILEQKRHTMIISRHQQVSIREDRKGSCVWIPDLRWKHAEIIAEEDASRLAANNYHLSIWKSYAVVEHPTMDHVACSADSNFPSRLWKLNQMSLSCRKLGYSIRAYLSIVGRAAYG